MGEETQVLDYISQEALGATQLPPPPPKSGDAERAVGRG